MWTIHYFFCRLDCLGWLPDFENADGDGYDQVGASPLITLTIPDFKAPRHNRSRFHSNYTYPPCTVADDDTKTEMIGRELQISQREKQEILAFESHLAAASTKQTITENNSLLLSQLTSLDPQ